MSIVPLKLNTFLRDAFATKQGATASLGTVPTKVSKAYPRMEKIGFESSVVGTTLQEALSKRTSVRNHSKTHPTREQYGTIFELALRESPEDGKRPYPSGGALYPIETYLVTQLENDSDLTAYHYQPKDHVLEKLWKIPVRYEIADLLKKEEPGASLIILTSQWHKTTPKYGHYAYNLALLEAGHVAQNILLACVATDVKACPMAGFNDETCSESLDLRPQNEQVLYAIGISA